MVWPSKGWAPEISISSVLCVTLAWIKPAYGFGAGMGQWAQGVPAPLATLRSAPPEKSRRGPIPAPFCGPGTPQPDGGDPEARLTLIQDTAARLLSPDEVTAVLRHCTRVRYHGHHLEVNSGMGLGLTPIHAHSTCTRAVWRTWCGHCSLSWTGLRRCCCCGMLGGRLVPLGWM